MICAWKELLALLPGWLADSVDKQGRDMGQELRLRLGCAPELITGKGSTFLNGTVTREDLSACINNASAYSPWAAATLSQGFLPVEGGHRMGVCGEGIIKDGIFTGFREISSVCIRIARDHRRISGDIREYTGSVLILGAPGWGKTTLLRDLARCVADRSAVCVADERGELFPKGFLRGTHMDVLSSVPKHLAIGMLVRTMAPDWIALDEITDPRDCQAILRAQGCGVRFLATAHAQSLRDLQRRPVYRLLLEHQVFHTVLLLQPDKSFRTERISSWSLNGSVRY